MPQKRYSDNPQTASDVPPDWYREDGTLKGSGYLGPIRLPNGGVASEFSIADSEQLRDARGNYLDYPSMVPTLTREEVDAVIRAASDPKRQTALPDSVYDKAAAFALDRKRKGLPLFAGPDEARTDIYPDLARNPTPSFVTQQYGGSQAPNYPSNPSSYGMASLSTLGVPQPQMSRTGRAGLSPDDLAQAVRALVQHSAQAPRIPQGMGPMPSHSLSSLSRLPKD